MGPSANLIIPRLNIRTMVPVYLIETRVFAPVLSVLSTKIDWTKPKYFTRLCYGHVFLRKSGKGVCLITVSKS